ncbi:MAG TPA: ATP-binding protein [Chloroflexota bacterium]|nr:ATP-binding protein [Chloroflexota bacterium]
MPSGSILIVDDEASVLETMQAILELDGYTVETASKGALAIELLQRQTYDVVLTDLRLDDVDGLSILSEVHRTAPDTVTVMLTGYASMDSAIAALRRGAYDYLVKPCNVEELKATVARGIEKRRLTRLLQERMRELEAANVTISSMNAQLQQRVEEATASLTERIAELARARDKIASLHEQAQEHIRQLETLDILKSQFLSMASHELKTPLASISGFVQVTLRYARRRLDRGRPDEAEWLSEQRKAIELLEIVEREVRRLARLVDELLDVSRIEAGQLKLYVESVDVRDLVTQVATRMQAMTTDHQLVLHPAAGGGAADGELVVAGDPDRLEQVMINLIDNAIKYSPNGGAIQLDVRRSGEQVLLSVQDHGVGIPSDELGTVFDLFYRSRHSQHSERGGIGLGLYISKEIVLRHGGQIWATSAPGQGSTFFVALPRRAPSRVPPA